MYLIFLNAQNHWNAGHCPILNTVITACKINIWHIFTFSISFLSQNDCRKCWWGYEEIEVLVYSCNAKWWSHGKQQSGSSKHFSTEVMYDLAVPLLDIYPNLSRNERPQQIYSCTFMFVHSRIINNCQKGEIIQCPLAGEWVNKIWFLHTAGYHTALKKKEILTHVMTQMDPEDMLS